MGRSQFPHALVPGQPSGGRRWHPGCRRCLLKGCEHWFLPRRPQARYCSPACQGRARRWRGWFASQRYRPPPTVNNAAATKPDAIVAGSDSDHLSPNPTTPPLTSSRRPRSSRPRLLPTTDPSSAVRDPGVGQRPAEIPQESSGRPCHRPGCYVLFLPAVRCPDQKFCSGSCRRALRRVRQREARLRHRRRRGARPLGHPSSRSP